MPLPILDHTGRPVRSAPRRPRSRSGAEAYGHGLFATPRTSGQTDYYRPRPHGALNLQTALNGYDWLELLEYSRQLFAQLPNVGHAILQKNLYAIGDAWKPQYLGINEEWGLAATEWLHQVWLPQCDLRGGVWDWQTNLLVSAMAWDVDGDDALIYLIDEHGFPRLKFIAAHQIGDGNQTNEVKGGPFDGAKICNGIITDRQDRFLGIRVVGEESNQWTDVPAWQCDLSFDPEFRSQHRGIPRLSKGILDWFDVQDIDTFLKRAVKWESSIIANKFTDTSEPEPNNDIIDERDPSAQATDIKVEKLYGGEVHYFSAAGGEKLEFPNSGRPSPNTEAFVQRLERRGLLAVGWFFELIDPSKIGGASVRLIQDLARASVRAKQKCLFRRAKRAVQFAVSVAMDPRYGRIPPNDGGDGDFLKWGFNLPALITVDAGYDEQADRDNMAIGSETLAGVCEKKGKWWQDTRRQRMVETRDLLEKASELVTLVTALGHKMDIREAINLLQRDPSSAAATSAAVAQVLKPAPAPAQEEKPNK